MPEEKMNVKTATKNVTSLSPQKEIGECVMEKEDVQIRITQH